MDNIEIKIVSLPDEIIDIILKMNFEMRVAEMRRPYFEEICSHSLCETCTRNTYFCRCRIWSGLLIVEF